MGKNINKIKFIKKSFCIALAVGIGFWIWINWSLSWLKFYADGYKTKAKVTDIQKVNDINGKIFYNVYFDDFDVVMSTDSVPNDLIVGSNWEVLHRYYKYSSKIPLLFQEISPKNISFKYTSEDFNSVEINEFECKIKFDLRCEFIVVGILLEFAILGLFYNNCHSENIRI